MIKMTKKIIFFLGLITSLSAQSPVQTFSNLQVELENLKKNYWDFKATALRERKELEDTLNLLDQQVKSDYLKKNNRQEEFFLIKENQDKLVEKLEEEENQITALYNRMRELTEIEKKKNRSLFPYLLENSINKLGKINGWLENNNHRRALTEIVDYRIYLLNQAKTSLIQNKKLFIPAQEQSVPGLALRLGFVHDSFTSDEASAILLRQTDLSGVAYEWKFNLPRNAKKEIQSSIQTAFGKAGENDLIRVPIDVAQAGDKLKSIAEGESGGWLKGLVKLFKSGGLLMYPLGAVAIIAFALMGERMFFFLKNTRGVRKIALTVTNHIAEGNRSQALDVCRNNDNPITRVLAPLLEKKVKDKNKGVEILEESLLGETPRLEKHLATLSVLAAVAPLMGLLGTVAGMIALFDVITLYGTNNPKILAGGISIALVTTQTGLSIAIPIMLIHHLLTRIKTNLMQAIEKNAIMVLNRLFS